MTMMQPRSIAEARMLGLQPFEFPMLDPVAIPSTAAPAPAVGSFGAGRGDPVAMALLAPEEPFVWGQGGVRLSPERVAALRAQGEQLSRGDYSPVGHWTQGLGRVLDGLDGGLKMKRAREAEQANSEADAALAERLAGGTMSDEMVARALMDPNVGAGVKEFAGLEYARRNPKKAAVAPTETEKLMLARGIRPGTPEWNAQLDAELLNQRDPMMTFSGPTFTYSGRTSAFPSTVGAGGQAGSAPAGPPAEAVAMLKGDPSPEARKEFDEAFGAGSADRVLGGGASNGTDPFPSGR